jgi:leucyl-tRNA synthetase
MDLKTEKKWQERWAKEKAFEIAPDPKKKKFFFTITYPYVSGSLHIGHARAAIEGDTFIRYKRMAGYDVLWGLGFHISGTPVMGIAAAIEAGDKKKIDLYKNYVRAYVKDEKEVEHTVASFKDPWNIVKFFVPKMKGEYSALGTSFDWRRSFTSGDPEHQALVTWQFKKYKELGLLTKASYPALYCKKEGHAVAEDDIVDGDTNPVEKQEMVLLKFKFEDGYIVAATLRPETVFGQTNLWINPDTEYVKANVDAESWILSREAAEKLQSAGRKVKIIGKVDGRSLLDKHALAPGVNREIPILPSKFALPERGSGIVTSVPSDAPYDYMALLDLQKLGKHREIKPIPIIETKHYGNMSAVKACEEMKIKDQLDPKLEEATKMAYKEGFHTGVMMKNCGKYASLSVAVAKEKVRDDLIKEGKADMMYDTSRHAVCRCGGEVTVALIKDQWFLDFNAQGWKEKAFTCLKGMQIFPEAYRKQFEDTFEWLDKRPCARGRGLGTQLPFEKNWMIESLSDSTIYMSLYPIIHRMHELKLKPEQMNDTFFDYVCLGKGEPAKCAKATGIPLKELKALHEEFDYWYGVDQRHTHQAHISNHLSFYIFAHSAIYPPAKWPKKVSIDGMVISEGAKMSKSKGNIITLLDAIKMCSADGLRAYMAGSVSMDAMFDWNKAEAEAVTRNVQSLYSILENAANNRNDGKLTHMGKWFESVFESGLKNSTKYLEEMRLRDYVKIILYDLPNAYRKLQARASESEIKAVNKAVAEKWIKMISPLLPNMAEELWEKTGNKRFVSLDTWPEHDEGKIDPSAEANERLMSTTLSDIEQIKKITGMEKPGKITIFVAPPWKYDVYKLVLDGTELKEIMAQEKYKKLGKAVVPYVQKLLKRKPLDELFLTAKSEAKNFKESKEFFEKEYDCTVEIIEAEHSENPRANLAEPEKPGILLE